MNASEFADGSRVVVSVSGQRIDVKEHEGQEPHSFLADSALWSVDPTLATPTCPFATQEIVFEEVGAPVLKHTWEGYNACIFAYGQTGSGKTYTMMGGNPLPPPPTGGSPLTSLSPPTNNEHEGIVPRVARSLFATAAGADASVRTTIELTFLEVYCEKVRCLLNPNGQTNGELHNLRVREHPVTGPFVEGLTKLMISSAEDFVRLVNEGNQARSTASTAMNATSSRSHAVVTINVTQKMKKGAITTTRHSRLNLVDLAGSERADKSLAVGKTLTEGSNINRSLLTLGAVINALSELSESSSSASSKPGSPPRHVPYRDSVLTWLLKDNLGGNSKTVMVAAVSPSSSNLEETLSTLRYAQRAKKIVNRAVVNESNDSAVIAALQLEIAALQDKLKHSASGSLEATQLKSDLQTTVLAMNELRMTYEEKVQHSVEVMKERDRVLAKMQEELLNRDERIQRLEAELSKTKQELEVHRAMSPLRASGSPATPLLSSSHVAGLARVPDPLTSTPDDIDIDDLLDVRSPRRKTADTTKSAFVDPLADPIPSPSHKGNDGDDLDLGDSVLPPHTNPAANPSHAVVHGTSSHPPAKSQPPVTYDDDDEDGDDGVPGDDDGEELASHESDSNSSDGPTSPAASPISGADMSLVVDEDGNANARHDERKHVNFRIRAMTVSSRPDTAQKMPAAAEAGALKDPPPPKSGVAAAHNTQTQAAGGVSASRHACDDAHSGHAEHAQDPSSVAASGRVELLTTCITSPFLAGSSEGYFRRSFDVAKSSNFGSTKKRTWLVDGFRGFFYNKRRSSDAAASFQHPACHLYKVERFGPFTVVLHFLGAPHAYELLCDTTARRNELYELAVALRRGTSLMWCPTLAASQDGAASIRHQVVERTLCFMDVPNPMLHNATEEHPKDHNLLLALTNAPYEIIRFWYGSFDMQHKPLPPNHRGLEGFMPKPGTCDICVIGVSDVAGSLMGKVDLGVFFQSYLGSSYHIVTQTTIGGKDKPTKGNHAMVVLCRRSFIVRISNVQAIELDTVRRADIPLGKGDFAAVAASFLIDESTVGCVLVHATPAMMDPSMRSAAMRSVFAMKGLGDDELDLGVRFDYCFIGGTFGFLGCYAGDETDELHMQRGNLLTQFREFPSSDGSLSAAGADGSWMRTLIRSRESTCRFDCETYRRCGLMAFVNVVLEGRMYVQRPLCSARPDTTRMPERTLWDAWAWKGNHKPSVIVKALTLSNVEFFGRRVPSVKKPTFRLIAPWVEGHIAVEFEELEPDERDCTSLSRLPVSSTVAVKPTTSDPAYLRLQHLAFSLVGSIRGLKDQDAKVVGSGCIAMKGLMDQAPLVGGTAPSLARGLVVPVLYRTTEVGHLKLDVAVSWE